MWKAELISHPPSMKGASERRRRIHRHREMAVIQISMTKKRRAWVQRGLGTSATVHARHLMGSLESSSRSAGHAARAACFFVPVAVLAFFRALSVLV